MKRIGCVCESFNGDDLKWCFQLAWAHLAASSFLVLHLSFFSPSTCMWHTKKFHQPSRSSVVQFFVFRNLKASRVVSLELVAAKNKFMPFSLTNCVSIFVKPQNTNSTSFDHIKKHEASWIILIHLSRFCFQTSSSAMNRTTANVREISYVFDVLWVKNMLETRSSDDDVIINKIRAK